MAKPIKAWLGKRYTTKSGVTKAYLYNPETEKYGWYNTGKYATEKGMSLFEDSVGYVDEEKVDRLRTNMKTVLREIASNNHVDGIDDLINILYDEIDSLSDLEVDSFANENSKAIQLYFEYKDVNEAGVDARIMKISSALGVDIYEYVDKEKVPEKVQNILNNIEHVVKFEKDFDKNDEISLTRASYATLTGRTLKK